MATFIQDGVVQSAVQDSADGPLGDGFGGVITTGTPITIVIPPEVGQHTRVQFFDYLNQGTAHTITLAVPLGDDSPEVTTDVALNGTTIRLDPLHIPHDSTGAVPAQNDWIVVRGADGQLYNYMIDSYSAPVLTLKVTAGYGDANGTGVAAPIPSGNIVWFFGAMTAADQPRRFLATASARTQLSGPLATTPKVYQPILVYSNNGTADALSMFASGDNPKPKA